MGEKRLSGTRKRVLLVLANLLSLAFLGWTLRDAHLGDLKDDLASMSWWWVALAASVDIAVYLWHALRWSLLLRPLAKVGYWRTVRAIYTGLFANEVLPLRAGEVLRCYILGRASGIPVGVTIASALIERVFDGIWLCLSLFLVLRMVELPHQFRYLNDVAYVLAAVVAGGAVLLAVALFRTPAPDAVAPPAGTLRHYLAVLASDLAQIGHSRYLYFAFLQSLPYLLLQVIPIWAAFKGYGFDLSISVAFVLLVILRVGAVVPQAPGNLGLFQFLTKECLERIFNVVPAEAARFSLVLWGIVTIPLLIGGLIALSVTEAKIGELRRAAEEEASTPRTLP